MSEKEICVMLEGIHCLEKCFVFKSSKFYQSKALKTLADLTSTK